MMVRSYQHGYVEVSVLSKNVGVSEATIRRALRNLTDQGLLELSHGGARVVRGADYSFLSKSFRNIEAKRVIDQLAAQGVRDGDQIFLDSGTTCFEMTQYLLCPSEVLETPSDIDSGQGS
ncbi:DeoR family transcriptional regulator [Planctomycetota bacterium]